MSDGIEYRRMVGSIARKLSAKERHQIAYINSIDPMENVTGIDLLARLEWLGVFSQKNIDGLLDTAKIINRFDLVDDINHYRKKAKTSNLKQGKKTPQKGTTLSAERQELEDTLEMLVNNTAVLEQHLSMLKRTLDGEGDPEDEGIEIVRHIRESAHGLASDLHAAHEKLARQTRSNSSETLSSGSSVNNLHKRRSFSDSSSPEFHCSLNVQPETPEKPIPKPRKNLGLPPPTTEYAKDENTRRKPPRKAMRVLKL